MRAKGTKGEVKRPKEPPIRRLLDSYKRTESPIIWHVCQFVCIQHTLVNLLSSRRWSDDRARYYLLLSSYANGQISITDGNTVAFSCPMFMQMMMTIWYMMPDCFSVTKKLPFSKDLVIFIHFLHIGAHIDFLHKMQNMKKTRVKRTFHHMQSLHQAYIWWNADASIKLYTDFQWCSLGKVQECSLT